MTEIDLERALATSILVTNDLFDVEPDPTVVEILRENIAREEAEGARAIGALPCPADHEHLGACEPDCAECKVTPARCPVCGAAR